MEILHNAICGHQDELKKSINWWDKRKTSSEQSLWDLYGVFKVMKQNGMVNRIISSTEVEQMETLSLSYDSGMNEVIFICCSVPVIWGRKLKGLTKWM